MADEPHGSEPPSPHHARPPSSASTARAREIRARRAEGPGLLGSISGMAYQRRHDGPWTLDMASGAALEVTGYRADELVGEGGLGLRRLVHEDDLDHAEREIARAVHENARYAVEFRIRHRDGETRWALDQGQPVLTPDGDLLALEGVLLDVSRPRELEAELRRVQRLETMGRLTGVVAHDFNNFLTGILGSLELASAETAASSSVQEYLALARRGAEKGRALARQLLTFSRKRLERPRVVDLSRVVREAGEFLRQIVGSPVRLSVRVPDAPVRVKMDPLDVEQAILNLVVNARDAIDHRGTVEVRLSAQDGRAVLEVEDTGRGMDEETSRKVFEAFYTTKDQGTGLGLATVRRIVEDVGGRLSLDTAPGEGTTVRIALPLTDETETRPKERKAPARQGGSERILVVEDDETVRELVATALRRFGYRVTVLPDVADVDELFGAGPEPPDLLITDITLPGMSGFDVARAFGERNPDAAVLYMSGYATGHRPDGEAQVDDGAFLEKPFSVNELLHAVRTALDGDELEREA